MNKDGCERLSNAIIIQAAKDYLKAKRENNTRKLVELKRFFHSTNYAILTQIDGDELIAMLDKKHEENIAKGGKRKQFDFRNA